MELEKYTERSKGFVQSAQNLALRSGHQRLSPEHLLKVLLEDKEGLCANLIRAAGGDPQPVLLAVDGELNKQPKVEGSGAGQVYMSPELARVFDQAEKIAEKAGDSYVTVERLLLALALASDTPAGKAQAAVGASQRTHNATVEEAGKGRKADTASAEEGHDALKKLLARPDEAARGKLDRCRPRRGDPPHDQVLSRRTGRQSVLIGGPVSARPRSSGAGAAHRQWRRAGELKDKRLLALDLGAMVAGAKYGEFQAAEGGVGDPAAAGDHRVHRQLHALECSGPARRKRDDASNAHKPRWHVANCMRGATSMANSGSMLEGWPWRGASSRCSSPSRRSRTRSRSCAASRRNTRHHGVRITDSAGRGGDPVAPLSPTASHRTRRSTWVRRPAAAHGGRLKPEELDDTATSYPSEDRARGAEKEHDPAHKTG
jgi:ATP-dependent Clp protease ATP-binding subunit ClpB